MKVSHYASNSNNFKLRIFLKSQSKGESSSLYTILDSQKFIFGDEEKNPRIQKPQVFQDDRNYAIYSTTSDRHKSTKNQSRSSQLRKLTQRITLSCDSEINAENPIQFYQILDSYNNQYLNLPFGKEGYSSEEKTAKKSKRLYTEQTEFKIVQQKSLKYQQTSSQHQNTRKSISLKQKLINFCNKNNKKIHLF